MRNISFIISVTLVIIFFYACTHPPQIPISGAIKQKDTARVDSTKVAVDTTIDIIDTSVCFQRDVLPIFTGSCAKPGCHDAITKAKGYNLTTYNTIILKGLTKYKSASSKLYTECTKGKMPQSPTPKLDSTQLSYIRRWIDNGSPNDTDCAVNCDTTKFTFAKAIVPILSKYCYSCHAAGPAASSGGGIVLDDYEGVAAVAQNGTLAADLKHVPGHNFMPLGGIQLSECKITQVSKWIAAGAQNN